MAPKSSSSPKGLALSKIHKVGEKIGQGEFGEVYAVKGSTNDTKWVVKVVPIPTKTTKKQTSPQEIAVARLYHEYLCYSNCRKWSGSLLPLLPSPLKDKVDLYLENLSGFRCLVMERLQGDFMNALPSLVDSSSRFVDLGKTAAKFIDIVKAMHDSSYLIIDIKPDNFMVAKLGAKVTDTSLSEALRLIDLGLVKAFSSVSGHTGNDGTTGVNGNALYASLNEHELNTPSRRDDVQSVLFLIGEIILQVKAIDQGTSPPYGTGNRASHLPWSQGQSDELVGEEKRRQVLDRKSAFYEAMPSDAADTLFQCINDVHEYAFKKKPDYAAIRDALSTLKVPRTSNKKQATRTSNKAEAVRTPPTRKSPRRRPQDTLYPTDEEKTDESPATSKRSSKSARARAMLDDDDDVIMEDCVQTDDELDDDNIENEEAHFVDVSAVKGYGLFCEEKDVWIVLSEQTGSSEVVVGRQPTSAGATFLLKDDTLLPSHVTLTISKTIKHAVHVKPRSKACLVKVMGGKVPIGGTCALAGQKIEIGSFAFKLRRLPVKATSEVIVRQPTASNHIRHRRAVLEIVAGSLRGNKYELIRGSRDAIIIGSKPSGGAYPVSLDDPGVAENHLQLELVDSKSHGTLVRIHDLGSTSGLAVNDEILIEETVSISVDSVIRLSDQAAISVRFME